MYNNKTMRAHLILEFYRKYIHAKIKVIIFLLSTFLIDCFAITINLAYVCNDRYVYMLATSLESVLSNKAEDDNINIYVLNPDFTEDTISKLRTMIGKRASVTFITFDVEPFERDAPKDFHFMAYTKCLVIKELSHLDKVLFLDVDTIVLQSLKELFETPLGDNYAGVVQDDQYQEKLDLYDNKKLHGGIYKNVKNIFNSGVMLLNIRKCIADDIVERFLYQMKFVKHLYGDQPIFYYLFDEKVVYVKPKWNAASLYFCKYLPFNKYIIYTENEIEEAKTNPAIIHFSGRTFLNINHPKRWMFFEYLSKTPWGPSLGKLLSAEELLRIVYDMSFFEFLKLKIKIFF